MPVSILIPTPLRRYVGGSKSVAVAAGTAEAAVAALAALSPDLAQRYGLTEKAGVVITDVDQGSPAAMVGLQEGDLIAEVNRKRVAKVAEFQSAVADARKDGSLLLLVKRKSASLFVVLPLK